MKDSIDKDAASDDLKEIRKMANAAGQDIADDAISDDVAPSEAEPAPKAKKPQ